MSRHLALTLTGLLFWSAPAAAHDLVLTNARILDGGWPDSLQSEAPARMQEYLDARFTTVLSAGNHSLHVRNRI